MGPDLPYALAIFAAVLALNGKDVDAHRALERYLAVSGIRIVAQWKAQLFQDTPAFLAHRERLYEGLRKAGMPEE
jgi:hypothetical protein